jgi:hypothetical protein
LDYIGEQLNKPQMVALALSDSPIGVAAWIVKKLKAWSDSPALEPVFTKEQVVTNVMIYLLTNTIGTAAWFYRGLKEDSGAPHGRVTVPTGFASSPHELTLLNPPRSTLERNFNLVHYALRPRSLLRRYCLSAVAAWLPKGADAVPNCSSNGPHAPWLTSPLGPKPKCSHVRFCAAIETLADIARTFRNGSS